MLARSAMAHHHAVGIPDDGWSVILLARVEAEPLRATVMETMAPLAALGIDVVVVQSYVDGKRAEIRDALRANGIVEYGEERALAIRIYTVEDPFALYKIINAAMNSPDRGVGPDGISVELLACLPYIKFLWVALEELPPQFHWNRKVHRGVKWAFPRVGPDAPVSTSNSHEQLRRCL